MSPSLRPAVVAKTSAGVLLAAAAAAGLAAPSAFALPAFYTPPTTLPAQDGALIRSTAMKLGAGVNIPGVASLPGKATRIMYKTTDTNGQAVAVTGTYIEPNAKYYGGVDGNLARPLVTYAEGTQGQGDECAPSLGLENPLGFQAGSVNVSYETPTIYNLLNRGFAVVVTDYVGLGTPNNVHTYVNRVDQGHAVLDAARAALKVRGATVTAASPVGAFGYSQGGGAVASAAELHSTYAPDVNLKAVFSGAPPADLSQVMRTADGTTLTAVIGFAVNGFVQTYPQLQPILDANTNNAGKAALKAIANACIGDGAAAYAYQKTNKWTTSGTSISTVVANNPAAKAIVDEQKIGRLKPTVPVRILTGTKDDIVTHSQVKQLAVDWCALGARVDYRPVIQQLSSFGTSLNHLGPMLTEGSASQQWLIDRLNGRPATSNCAQLPRLQ